MGNVNQRKGEDKEKKKEKQTTQTHWNPKRKNKRSKLTETQLIAWNTCTHDHLEQKALPCHSSFILLCCEPQLCLISDLARYLNVKHMLEFRIFCIYRMLYFFDKSLKVLLCCLWNACLFFGSFIKLYILYEQQQNYSCWSSGSKD
jgi:hypothetical protein